MASEGSSDRFVHRALFVILSSALVLTLLIGLWYASHILLLAFAGVLLGVLLHTLTRWLRFRTGMHHGVALAIVVVVVVAMLSGAAYATGRTLAAQGQTLIEKLPKAFDKLRHTARGWPLVGTWLAGEEDRPADESPVGAPATQPTEKEQLEKTIKDSAPRVATTVTTIVGSLVNGVVSLVVVSVVGIYIAASPLTYAGGLVRLTPKRYRERACETIAAVVYTLRYWLMAQGITMVIIGLLTGAGLYFIGVKLWLLFGVLAALFNFIPNFGPLISFLPAVLVAWSDDPSKVPWVTALYIVAQCVEGYVLTPLVQREVVNTPPAVLIVSQVLFGALGGALGVMLAAPLTAIGLVLVRMLYVEDGLDDQQDPIARNPEIQSMARTLRNAADA